MPGLVSQRSGGVTTTELLEHSQHNDLAFRLQGRQHGEIYEREDTKIIIVCQTIKYMKSVLLIYGRNGNTVQSPK